MDTDKMETDKLDTDKMETDKLEKHGLVLCFKQGIKSERHGLVLWLYVFFRNMAWCSVLSKETK